MNYLFQLVYVDILICNIDDHDTFVVNEHHYIILTNLTGLTGLL